MGYFYHVVQQVQEAKGLLIVPLKSKPIVAEILLYEGTYLVKTAYTSMELLPRVWYVRGEGHWNFQYTTHVKYIHNYIVSASSRNWSGLVVVFRAKSEFLFL